MSAKNTYKCIVIGASAGGMKALKGLFSTLPTDFSLPIVIVKHVAPDQPGNFGDHLQGSCLLPVKEADEKEPVIPGIYFAPPNYHLLIEPDETFSLSTEEKVNFARPSIDVLFESAADVYASHLIGVILTGANCDGAYGLKLIKEKGGMAIVQDPSTAEFPMMPQSAISTAQVDYILPLEAIGELLGKLRELS